MEKQLEVSLSLSSYSGAPYPATLSSDGTELWVSAVVESERRDNTVRQALEQGFQVHIFLGRTVPTPVPPPAGNTTQISAKTLGQLFDKLAANTTFACEATCIGIHP